MGQGWVQFHRGLLEHDMWTHEVFTRGQAWVDLFASANHADGNAWMDGQFITVKRASFITSILKLSARWKWSQGKTKAFLGQLAVAEMIAFKSDNKKTTITILNYSRYQPSKPQKGEQNENKKRTEKEQNAIGLGTDREQTETNNNDLKMNNNGEEASSPRPPLFLEKGKQKTKIQIPPEKIPASLNTKSCMAALKEWTLYLHEDHGKHPTNRTLISLLARYDRRPNEFIRDVQFSIERGWLSVNKKHER